MTSRSCWVFLCNISLLALLAGCMTPFGQDSSNIDWSAPPRAGTITISDPKLYRREALIDERRKDVDWIDGLIKKSEDIPFKPEILREIETITAISGALGLKFDPTAAISYQRANETGDLRQQIDVMKLQLQLDQLRRDAELVRAKFESQTDPLNADLGKLTEGSATAASGISAADQLKAAVDRLAAWTYDFNKEVKGTATAASSMSPLDDFRDRQAYRDMLKAARNASSLDELHDLRGSALLRLNFQATVIPDAAKSRVPGVVQMRVVPPGPGSALTNRFYRGWLDYINRRANQKHGSWDFAPNQEVLQGAVTDNFEKVYFLYSPTPGGPAAANCHGIVAESELSNHAACSTLVFVAPQQSSYATGAKAFMSFSTDLDLMLRSSDADDQRNRQWLVSDGAQLVRNCVYVDAPGIVDANNRPLNAYRLQRALRDAQARLVVGDHYIALDRLARDILRSANVSPAADPDLERVRERTAQAGILLETFRNHAIAEAADTPEGHCTPAKLKSFDRETPVIYLTPWAQEALWGDSARVAIYEIGPREQVQQMSTVARSANSLSLALSVAASAPGTGAAGEAAVGYSRQAMGRAEALERLPTVVGYSVGSQKTFGWVLGPRATINPKGKINLAQGLRTYDLTVDLSVPGWWPEFTLETLTAWAPKRDELVNGSVTSATLRDAQGNTTTQTIATRTIEVPMLANEADYAGFTMRLASAGFEPRREAGLEVDGSLGLQQVSACRASTIVLKGPLLWRATTVIVGGVKLQGSALSLLPDMGGVLLDVPALGDVIVGNGVTTHVTILTPYGPTGVEVAYEAVPTGGCKKDDKEAKKPDPNAPNVEKVNPTIFQLPGTVKIRADGKQLKKVTRVTFGVVTGTMISQTDDVIEVKFPQDETAVMPAAMAVPVTFYYFDDKKKEQKVEKAVAIISNLGGK